MHKRRVKAYIAIFLSLSAIAGMVSLGLWQLDRMHQKEQRLASIAQKKQQGPTDLTMLPLSKKDMRDFPVRFTGKPAVEQTMFYDNQIEAGKVGYEVIVPVATSAGWVLVNYGWVVAGPTRAILPDVTIEAGDSSYQGIIHVPETNPLISETVSAAGQFPKVIQQLDIERIETLTGRSLLPFVVLLTSENPEYIRHWPAVVMSPQKHLGYALQWFGLALAAGVVVFYVCLKRVREHGEK